MDENPYKAEGSGVTPRTSVGPQRRKREPFVGVLWVAVLLLTTVAPAYFAPFPHDNVWRNAIGVSAYVLAGGLSFWAYRRTNR